MPTAGVQLMEAYVPAPDEYPATTLPSVFTAIARLLVFPGSTPIPLSEPAQPGAPNPSTSARASRKDARTGLRGRGAGAGIIAVPPFRSLPEKLFRRYGRGRRVVSVGTASLSVPGNPAVHRGFAPVRFWRQHQRIRDQSKPVHETLYSPQLTIILQLLAQPCSGRFAHHSVSNDSRISSISR